jgi:hypothetical protein
MINLAFAYFIFTIDDHNNIKKVDKITHINKLCGIIKNANT